MSGKLLKFFMSGNFLGLGTNSPQSKNSAPESQPVTVFEGESPFNRIIIRDEGPSRTMYFAGPDGDEEAETAINRPDPTQIVFEYPGLMLTALALAPGRRILLVGLGGGYLPGFFSRFLPEREMTVVEVDPLVAELAGSYFGFTPGPNIRLVLADGRDFISVLEPAAFDQIWLDAFSGDYVPDHLSGLAFLELCRDRLTPGGLLAQNLHQSRPWTFNSQLKTTEAAFGSFLALKGSRCGNAVVLARRPEQPGDKPVWRAAELMAAVKKFGPRLGPYDLTAEIRKAKVFRIDPEARILP